MLASLELNNISGGKRCVCGARGFAVKSGVVIGTTNSERICSDNCGNRGYGGFVLLSDCDWVAHRHCREECWGSAKSIKGVIQAFANAADGHSDSFGTLSSCYSDCDNNLGALC